jgi:hypothetical protein
MTNPDLLTRLLPSQQVTLSMVDWRHPLPAPVLGSLACNVQIAKIFLELFEFDSTF